MASFSVARISVASFKDRLPQPCVVFSCGSGGRSGSRGGFRRGDAADVGKEPSPPPSPSSSCSDATSSAVEPPSPASSRRTQRVLKRWASHQEREMVTTVERQAHEAELSALSAASEPVFARAATFLHRESPPGVPPASPPEGPPSGGRCGVDDLPRNVRASSLIQMWRELEADGGIAASPRAAGAGGGSSLASGSAGRSFFSAEEPCGSSEACDDSEWEPEVTGLSKHLIGLADGERERVGYVVKRPTSGAEAQSSSAYGTGENEPFAQERSLLHRENADSVLLKRTARQLRGRRMIDDLLARMKQERQRELDRLMDCHRVSRFPYRSRIQSLLRFWGPQRLLMIQHQEVHESTALELDSLRQRGSTIWFLRERFSSLCQQGNNVGQAADGKAVDILSQDSSLDLNYPLIADRRTSASPQDQEVAAANDSQTVLEEDLSQTRSEGLQEDGQTALSWQDNSLQISNIGWQIAIGSSNLDHWEGDLVTEETDFGSLEDANGTWPDNASHRHIGWENHRQAIYHESNENYPDRVEIQELLERKPVSSSLASNFREIMDRLVLSLLQRQQSMYQSIAEEEAEEELEPVQRQDDGFSYADQPASSVPLSCQIFRSPVSQQGSCLSHQSSHRFETELMHDLRNDIAEIHHEMYELRNMLETCMDGQSKLQNLIREEVSSMAYNTVGITYLLHSSKWGLTRKGNCCVCYEIQIDSLLYRCGHMCTCYKCAQELQWGAGRCPICRAPIDDVVRAYFET